MMRGVPVGHIPGLPGLARRGKPGADAHLTLSRRKRRKYCGNSTNSKSAPKSRTVCRPSRTCRKPPRGSRAPSTSSWPGALPTKRVSRCKAGRRQARGTDRPGEAGRPGAQLRAGRRMLQGWAGCGVRGRRLCSAPAAPWTSDMLRSTEQPLKDSPSGKLAQDRPRGGGRRDSARREVRRAPSQTGRGQ